MQPPHEPQIRPEPHSAVEDIYAIAVGILFVAFGLTLLKAGGLVTGGTAGVALLLSQVLPISVGLLFNAVNLPFFLFAYFTMGSLFTVKTIGVNLGILIAATLIADAVSFQSIDPGFAALMGGSLCGMGMLALARHGAGVGGIGVLTLWLYKRRGINAGRTQVIIDAVILAIAACIVSLDRISWSCISAIAISGIIITWHRPGRYTGY